LWTSKPYEIIAFYTYDNGKVFFGGRNGYRILAADARTGNVLWESNCPEFVTNALAGYGKLYTVGWTGGCCYDQETGKLLWRVPNHGREVDGAGCAVAYNKFYCIEADSYLYALDANTGAMVWKYRMERAETFPAGPAEGSLSEGDPGDITIVDGKLYFRALGHTRYGSLIDPGWVSVDGNQWNPHDYTVLAQPGTGYFVCLDAESGKLIWKVGPEEVGPPGISLGGPTSADGRVYAHQDTMSGHIGVGASRPYSTIDYDKIINYEWFPPAVYCFGKGPTQFRDLAIDKSEVKFGENVTITGKLVDLSPAIDRISSLSTYKRDIASPATKVPVVLSFISSNGTKVPFSTVKTDKDGKFAYTWYPWETGPLSIVVESAGSDSYEAPDTTYTAVSVKPVVPDLVPLLEGALAVAVIIAVALPVIIYIRKPKP
jgi:hypothetical protein